MNDIYPEDYENRMNSPKRSGLSKFFSDPQYRLNRLLFFTGNAAGLGISGYLMMSYIFSLVLIKVSRISYLYDTSLEYKYLLETLYSFFCVGLPFLAVYIILKKTNPYKSLQIPLGRAYPSSDTGLIIIAGLGVCFIGSVLTNYFAVYADAAGFGFSSYYAALDDPGAPDGIWGIAILILHSAVVPAMVEEFAFRGVLMQPLRKFGDKFAIISSAVLFGLIHGNMTQMPFAIIAGLALGYSATVTGTLRTSIAIHFLNNFISVMVSVVMTRFGEGPAAMFSSAVIYGFIILGLICLAVYAYRNPRFMRLRPGQFGLTNKKVRCYFLAPIMIIGIIWICWYILLDIEPVYYFIKGA
ncbi:MAG: CPBP family intramembrane metalloprotease [Oscillospiraceae bacterium]|nr:CPBP family intramembrane metalloprotease [Oscillospiraceae bacterium]